MQVSSLNGDRSRGRDQEISFKLQVIRGVHLASYPSNLSSGRSVKAHLRHAEELLVNNLTISVDKKEGK